VSIHHERLPTGFGGRPSGQHRDGIDDSFMKNAASALSPGQAGLFLLIRKMTTDKVLADLQGVGRVVMKTSLDHTREEELREALAGHLAAVTPPETSAAH